MKMVLGGISMPRVPDAAIDDDSFREEYTQSEDWEDGYEARTATTTPRTMAEARMPHQLVTSPRR